jgi:hypothetical protein
MTKRKCPHCDRIVGRGTTHAESCPAVGGDEWDVKQYASGRYRFRDGIVTLVFDDITYTVSVGDFKLLLNGDKVGTVSRAQVSNDVMDELDQIAGGEK